MPKPLTIPIDFHAPEHMRWIGDGDMMELIDQMLPIICGKNRKDRYGHVRKTLREKNFPCAKWSLPFELFRHLCETRSELNRVREEGSQEQAQAPPPREAKVDETLILELDMLKRELEREKKLSQAYSDMIDILRSQ